MKEKIYLSASRYEELKKELAALKRNARFKVAEKLKNAKEFGDLSENFEYQAAKEEQAKLETKILELEEMLRRAVIIKKGSSDKVGLGSTVHLKKNGEVFVFKIVGSLETQPLEGRISNESPLGKLLLGKRVGEKVLLKTAKGEAVYEILAIE